MDIVHERPVVGLSHASTVYTATLTFLPHNAFGCYDYTCRLSTAVTQMIEKVFSLSHY